MKSLKISTLVLSLLIPIAGFSQETIEQGSSDTDDNGWEFIIAPYALAANLESDSTVGQATGYQ